MQSFKDCVFCFRPASLPAHPPLMPVYHVGQFDALCNDNPSHSSTYARVSCRDRLFVVSGKGSSGLSRTKKVGAASRYDDNLHTSISLQVVFSP